MFNKQLWANVSKLNFLESYPALPCPYCKSMNLKLDTESFTARKLSWQARRAYQEQFKDNELMDFANKEDNSFFKLAALVLTAADGAMYQPSQFIAFFKCGMCNENVSSTGLAKIPNNDTSVRQIKVESFNPPLPLFPLSETTPTSINEELLSSFNHFFSDTCSSGNRLRRAVEKLCLELGYTQERNLYQNIEAMADEFPLEARWLQSLRLVGNEATHADKITEDDLLDSYKVFEVVLDIFRRKHIEPEIEKVALQLQDKFKKPHKQLSLKP